MNQSMKIICILFASLLSSTEVVITHHQDVERVKLKGIKTYTMDDRSTRTVYKDVPNGSYLITWRVEGKPASQEFDVDADKIIIHIKGSKASVSKYPQNRR
jgi:hypothetical protein